MKWFVLSCVAVVLAAWLFRYEVILWKDNTGWVRVITWDRWTHNADMQDVCYIVQGAPSDEALPATGQ